MMITSESFETNIASLLGKKGWVISENSLPWQRDWLDKYGDTPVGVARPSSTDEVSKVLKLCKKHSINVAIQGGNTGLVGGSVLVKRKGIILSLDRMNKVLCIDDISKTVTLESGVILEQLHELLKTKGLMFPMHLGSEGSAQIGGLVATNSGGSHSFRYGMMQDLVIGLEVVLADGKVWNGMREVQKDNTGYQLRKLFCGSEGTLGVITKAVLKLFPSPRQQVTSLLSVRDFSALLDISNKLGEEVGEFLTSMEFFSDTGLDIALTNIPELVFPLNKRAPYYVLIEAGSSSMKVALESILLDIMQRYIDKKIVLDGTIASSELRRKALWRLREEQPEGQRRLGAQLKHDISVPPGKLGEFIDSAKQICNNLLPGVRINPFGHLGDGNVHFNLSPPKGKEDFSKLDDEIYSRLAELASSMSGSFAAEHGIGRVKIIMADKLRDPIERDIMNKLKKSLDELNQLNPGVLFSEK